MSELNTRHPVVLPATPKGTVHVVGRCAQRAGTSIPESTLKQLRSLGYQGGSTQERGGSGTNSDLLSDENKIAMAKKTYRLLHPTTKVPKEVSCPHCHKSFPLGKKNKKKVKKEKKTKG